MDALIIAGIVLTCIAVYFGVGFRLAVRDIPSAWDRAEKAWNSSHKVRESVKQQFAAMLFLWPILGPIRIMNQRIDQAISDGNPAVLRKKLVEQMRDARLRELERDATIARLERELGIGDPRPTKKL